MPPKTTQATRTPRRVKTIGTGFRVVSTPEIDGLFDKLVLPTEEEAKTYADMAEEQYAGKQDPLPTPVIKLDTASLVSKDEKTTRYHGRIEEYNEMLWQMDSKQSALFKIAYNETITEEEKNAALKQIEKNEEEKYQIKLWRYEVYLLIDPKSATPPPVMPKSMVQKPAHLQNATAGSLDEKLRKIESFVKDLSDKLTKLKEINATEADVLWERYYETAKDRSLSTYAFALLLDKLTSDHKMSTTFRTTIISPILRRAAETVEDKTEAQFLKLKDSFFQHFVTPGYQARAMVRLFCLTYRKGEKTKEFGARVIKEIFNCGFNMTASDEFMKTIIKVFYWKYPIAVQTYMATTNMKNKPEDFESLKSLIDCANLFMDTPVDVPVPRQCCIACDKLITCGTCTGKKPIIDRLGEPADKKGDEEKTKCNYCKKSGHLEKECRKRKAADSKDKKDERPGKIPKTDTDKPKAKIPAGAKMSFADAKEKGICAFCEKPWAPGHSCGKKKEKAASFGLMDHGETDPWLGDELLNFKEDFEDDDSDEERDTTGSRGPGRFCKAERFCMMGAKSNSREFVNLPAIINDHKIMMVVDSAATLSFMTPRFAASAGIKVVPQEGKIHLAKKNITINRTGRTEKVKVWVSGKGAIEHQFDIFDLNNENTNVVLGLDAFRKFGIEIAGIPVDFPTDEEITGVSDDIPPLISEPVTPVTEEFPELLNLSVLEIAVKLDEFKHDVNKIETSDAYYNALLKLFSEKLKEEVSELMTKNSEIRGFCTHPDAFLPLDVGDAKPVKKHPYRIPLKLGTFVDHQILGWRAETIIYPVNGNYEWNNPLLVVPKRDIKGDVKGQRLCIDPRPINALLKSVNYPLPLIKDLLEGLTGSVVYTKIDLRLGFNQFQVVEKDRHITTFTHKGQQYQFRGVPFGFKHTPAIFQRVINDILKKFKGFAFNYIDDIIIHSSSFVEHINHVILVIEILNFWNLRANDKTEFGLSEMLILGFRLSPSGIKIAREKLVAMDHWREPTNGNMVEKHLGFFNYFRDMIPNYSQIVAPLEKLRKEKKVVWTDEYRAIYQKMRNILSSETILSYPNFDHPFLVATDASNYGLGAVLYQEYDGKTHFIAFGARALHGGEKNYGATKRELLGIIFALEHFRYYLIGSHFKLYTDHRALTFMFTQKHVNPMLNSWLETLLSFDFEPIHRPGLLNILPDAISRFFDSDPQPEILNPVIWSMEDEDFIELEVEWKLTSKIFERLNKLWGPYQVDVFASAGTHQVPKYFDKQLNAFTQSWKELGKCWIFPPTKNISQVVNKIIKEGVQATLVTPNMKNQAWYEKLKFISTTDAVILPVEAGSVEELRPSGAKLKESKLPEFDALVLWNVDGTLQNAVEIGFKDFGELMSVEESDNILNDMLKKGKMEIVEQIIPHFENILPEDQRIEAMTSAHLRGHNGAEGMVNILLNEGKQWESMQRDCKNFVKTCLPCQRFVIGRRGFHPTRSFHAELPWDHIGVDLKSFNTPSVEGNHYLLVVVDICTRFVFLRPIFDKSMETVSKTLFKLFCDIGFPKIIQSDRGSEFVNELMTKMVMECGIDHRLITAYHPQGNGITERYVGIVSEMIYKQLKGKADLWEKFIPSTQMWVNTRQSKSTKSTPYSLMFARSATPFLNYVDAENKLLDGAEVQRRLEFLTHLVYPTIADSSKTTKNLEGEKINQNVKKSGKLMNPLRAGAIVMTVDELKSSKTQQNFDGPFKIIRKNKGGAYVIEDRDGTTFTRAPNQLKVVARKSLKEEVEDLENNNTEVSYEIKKLLNHRDNKDGTHSYLVSWKGYDDSANEWIHEKNFDSFTPINKYWKETQTESKKRKSVNQGHTSTKKKPRVQVPSNKRTNTPQTKTFAFQNPTLKKR